jgi:hypothetical protein
MHKLCLPLLLLTTSCSFPQYTARKTVVDSLPADGIREIHCTSHNGSISIEGKPGASEIRIRVEMSVRGYTQAEADANIEQLETLQETVAGRLTLTGKYDPQLSNMSPRFSFIVEGPPELILQLTSHNGHITTIGTSGPLACKTHNGNIESKAEANQVSFITHNGHVEIDIDGSGELNGKVISHNGNVVVGVARDLDTLLDASTHNGRILLKREAVETTASKHRLECRLGDGGGRLSIEAHNGNVVIR